MDSKRICKICNRRFANGKAMGGHMRSHMAKLPISPKPNNPSPILTTKSTSSSSSLSNMQTYRSVNREFFDLVSDDGESEGESLKNPTKRRSKRRRRTIASVVAAAAAPPPTEPESVSSVTENIFTDEEVAMFLVMLSREKWPENEPVKDKEVSKEVVVDEYVENEGEGEKEKQDEQEEEDVSFMNTSGSNILTRSNNKKYKCKTCKKRFPSYQALGGHKASHKKMKIQQEGSSNSAGTDVIVLDQRIFECPFCDKVFDSGQALGGHKKIHFSYLSVTKASPNSGKTLIDLNLPAPPEEDSEVSQV
ncbi:Zinc finger protein [Melia azedarach]|uniref:Zinc finger protein n=1 Tax=Melia azedarach TaxID=155640 RepID=A0ACC1X5N3_MELAZ|nr:Zinc finger protein [Melia azedarach]